MQCPEHVYAEKEITKNLLHPFCLRQYASFQVGFGGQVLGKCVAPACCAPVVSLVRWLCCGRIKAVAIERLRKAVEQRTVSESCVFEDLCQLNLLLPGFNAGSWQACCYHAACEQHLGDNIANSCCSLAPRNIMLPLPPLPLLCRTSSTCTFCLT